MILGIGVDIVSNNRFEGKGKGFLEKLFLPSEIEKGFSAPSESEYFASRFASKEAVAKAFGTGFRGLSPLDIEVCEDGLGKPYVKIHKEIDLSLSIHLSISHERDSSIAMVVIEDGKK